MGRVTTHKCGWGPVGSAGDLAPDPGGASAERCARKADREGREQRRCLHQGSSSGPGSSPSPGPAAAGAQAGDIVTSPPAPTSAGPWPPTWPFSALRVTLPPRRRRSCGARESRKLSRQEGGQRLQAGPAGPPMGPSAISVPSPLSSPFHDSVAAAVAAREQGGGRAGLTAVREMADMPARAGGGVAFGSSPDGGIFGLPKAPARASVGGKGR